MGNILVTIDKILDIIIRLQNSDKWQQDQIKLLRRRVADLERRD